MAHEKLLRAGCQNSGYCWKSTGRAGSPSPAGRRPVPARPDPAARRTLGLAACALALWLYNQYLIAPGDAVVEEQDMTDHLLGYKPPPTPTRPASPSGRGRRSGTCSAGLIRDVPGTSRYLISPVITAVLSAERVAALAGRYRT